MTDSLFANDVRLDASIPVAVDNCATETRLPKRSERSANFPALPKSLKPVAYNDIVVSLDPDRLSYWLAFRQDGVPSFTLNMLRELNQSHRMIHQMVLDRAPGEAAPVKFFVACSDTPGIFSFGGDLAYFKRCILEKDRVALLAYAYACVEAMYNNAFGFDVPVISIGVIEGDALGGGFEAALSFNVLIAERGVKMGLPEVLFNSFPGMGAYSFLSRKLDAARAEKMILSGKMYLAEDLHDMGVVDILTEKGQGREAARTYIAENTRRHSMLYALNKVRQKVNGLDLMELREITEIWVDTVMSLPEADVRKMEIVRAAQFRRLQRSPVND